MIEYVSFFDDAETDPKNFQAVIFFLGGDNLQISGESARYLQNLTKPHELDITSEAIQPVTA
ncbi:MAG: hypothetical protein F6K31_15025 [Symploca sp. SIO2G7]|nr:hypothetical protein [Symploca sp. SIO2G7]